MDCNMTDWRPPDVAPVVLYSMLYNTKPRIHKHIKSQHRLAAELNSFITLLQYAHNDTAWHRGINWRLYYLLSLLSKFRIIISGLIDFLVLMFGFFANAGKPWQDLGQDQGQGLPSRSQQCTHKNVDLQGESKNNTFNICWYFNSACTFLNEILTDRWTIKYTLYTNFCWNIYENDNPDFAVLYRAITVMYNYRISVKL